MSSVLLLDGCHCLMLCDWKLVFSSGSLFCSGSNFVDNVEMSVQGES